ncbi:MAG: hypothetical protein SGPRY_001674 [Prymnesium sp.]
MHQLKRQYAASFRVKVAINEFLVNEISFPFDPLGVTQLEVVDHLRCDTRYRVSVSACSRPEEPLGGCSSELEGYATTAPCKLFSESLPLQMPFPHAELRLGCKDPEAANFDVNAELHDNSTCLTAKWGCTLPSAENFDPGANSNDRSCKFPASHCAMPLTEWPHTATVDMEDWPIFSHELDDGSNCSIGPVVTFAHCLTLIPPRERTRDAVVSFPSLPAGPVHITAEVGMQPSAAVRGKASFEMRLMDSHGDVIVSDSSVRGRTGQLIPPATLRVATADASGLTLQLRLNNEDGVSLNDFIVMKEANGARDLAFT